MHFGRFWDTLLDALSDKHGDEYRDVLLDSLSTTQPSAAPMDFNLMQRTLLSGQMDLGRIADSTKRMGTIKPKSSVMRGSPSIRNNIPVAVGSRGAFRTPLLGWPMEKCCQARPAAWDNQISTNLPSVAPVSFNLIQRTLLSGQMDLGRIAGSTK